MATNQGYISIHDRGRINAQIHYAHERAVFMANLHKIPVSFDLDKALRSEARKYLRRYGQLNKYAEPHQGIQERARRVQQQHAYRLASGVCS